MSDLRQRVADEVASALLGNGIGHDPDDAAHVADAALSVFAEWLRERAWTATTVPQPLRALVDERAGRVHSAAGSVMSTLAETLTEFTNLLADEITPKP